MECYIPVGQLFHRSPAASVRFAIHLGQGVDAQRVTYRHLRLDSPARVDTYAGPRSVRVRGFVA